MSEIAVENINVAEILENEKSAEGLEKVKEVLDSDPEVSALVKAAESIEDVYEIVKKFSKATFEQVKVIFQKTVDYFKEAKAELSDEVLDSVVGGWSLSSWWKKNKKDIIGGAVWVACIGIGIAVGACTAGLGGALIGGCVGVVGGAVAGGVAYAVTGIVEELSK